MAAAGLRLVLCGSCLGGWVAAAAAVPHPADEQIEQTAQEVLARPEFSGKEPILQQILRAFFEWLGGLGAGQTALFWIVLLVCIILLLLLVVYISFTVRRVLFFSPGSADERAAAARKQRLSAAFFEEAGRCAARQDFTEAVRCLFLSLVYRLDETGTVDFPHSTTNREYLHLFAKREPLQQQLRIFVDALDENWYGQQSMPRGEYDRCLELYQTLR
jgi:uncharacterized integral membrane protein